MSKLNYIYVDDENGASETATLHGFNDIGQINVVRFPLAEFKEFGQLRNELIAESKSNKFNGIIIDLRIDGTGEDHTEFNASAITQELRSIAARGEITTFPIILCSTEEKIKQTYNTDKTSHDLFDYKIYKTNSAPDWSKLSRKLYSLAYWYAWLQQEKPELQNILGLPNLNSLDDRIKDRLSLFATPYDYTNFVIKNLLHQTNPLINHRILAARLGVDLSKTHPDIWSIIIAKFSNAKYRGLFSDGWDRWWANGVNDLFFEMSSEKLQYIGAERRVQILREIIGSNEIVAAVPLKYCTSTEYWTICEGYKTPLDPLEGFKILTSFELKPWQESKYMSLLAILEREGLSDRGLMPHPSEKERIQYNRDLLGL